MTRSERRISLPSHDRKGVWLGSHEHAFRRQVQFWKGCFAIGPSDLASDLRLFADAGFFGEDASYLFAQDGATIFRGTPYDDPVDPEVGVDKNITEGHDLSPRHLKMAGL